ncbi:hypothetical protein C9374_000034 [Naegleria lovaniensis]|uniref:DUF4116 domain-containing protein n=1 Tax=Naegleria lovaniensis TaxID=51637 RepID=A0AA88GTI3_NAELO|nr:uncharacterized protein C9374_000034 [Naegleria lovaniensis]KAG2388595.1 hypothetical protein C9374_000034 [Naegleria lovaniensis]
MFNLFHKAHSNTDNNEQDSENLQTKKQKLRQPALILIHFSNSSSFRDDDDENNSTHLQRLQMLLRKKFSLQQVGKKKWVLNRELKYEKFFPVEFMNDQEFVFHHLKKYRIGLKHASMRLRDDREFVMQIVQHKGSEIFYTTSRKICRDKQVVMAAIKNEVFAALHASRKLKNDRDFVLEAVQLNGEVLANIGRTFHQDREIVLAAVKQNGTVLGRIVQEEWSDGNVTLEKGKLRSDPEIALEAIKQNKKALFDVPNNLHRDLSFMSKALQLIYPDLKNFDYSSKEIMLNIVQDFPFLLKFASDEIKNDRDVVINAICNSVHSLEFASDSCKNDKEIALLAVRLEAIGLCLVSQELKNDYDVVLAAVHRDGNALSYASETLKRNKEILLTAIKTNARAFIYMSKELKSDKEFILQVVRKNGSAIVYLDDATKEDEEIIVEAIKQDPKALRYAPTKFRHDPQFLLRMVKLGCKHFLSYIGSELPKNKEFMIQVVKEIGLYDLASPFVEYPSFVCYDKDIMLEAVKKDGYALIFASKELQNDPELVMEALKCNGYVSEYSDEFYRERMQYCYHDAYLGTKNNSI